MCAQGIVGCFRSIPVRPGVVGFVPVRSAHSRAPWVRRVNSVHSRAFWVSSGSFVCVRSISVRPGGLQVRSCAFCPFPCALWVVWFVRVRSFHSRSPLGSFGYVRSVPVRPGDRRVRSVHSRTPWR